MPRYHISPSTGRPNICQAKISCPFGHMETDHYDSKDAARAAYEQRMSGNTFTPLKKKLGDSDVISLAEKRAAKEAAPGQVLAAAKETHDFEATWEAYPKYLLAKAEVKMVEDLAAGKKVSDEKLDLFLAEKSSVTDSGYADPQAVVTAQKLLGFVREVRDSRGTPSTMPTIEKFDPSKQTLFSNAKARTMPSVMGKAIRREQAHADWMYELAEQRMGELPHTDDESERERIRAGVAELRLKGQESEARVAAQLRELQWCFDNDEQFAKNCTSDQRRMLLQGWFRPKASSFDGVFIGRVGKVR